MRGSINVSFLPGLCTECCYWPIVFLFHNTHCIEILYTVVVFLRCITTAIRNVLPFKFVVHEDYVVVIKKILVYFTFTIHTLAVLYIYIHTQYNAIHRSTSWFRIRERRASTGRRGRGNISDLSPIPCHNASFYFSPINSAYHPLILKRTPAEKDRTIVSV